MTGVAISAVTREAPWSDTLRVVLRSVAPAGLGRGRQAGLVVSGQRAQLRELAGVSVHEALARQGVHACGEIVYARQRRLEGPDGVECIAIVLLTFGAADYFRVTLRVASPPRLLRTVILCGFVGQEKSLR